MKGALLDPTTIRLSDHFLLSDVMGCHSVYTRGYPNHFTEADEYKLAEGVYLAEQVLEPVVQHSPVSISYGYISLPLARQIVKYQSPEKPSYHQWNDGAACDIIVHSMDAKNVAPIYIAAALDEEFPMSRTITYSESPYICVATRSKEAAAPRKAFYENRYTGRAKAKPEFVTVPQNRGAYFEQHALEHPWRGAGYPTYHGGGIRQTHHIRIGRYLMYSDLLYSTEAMQQGYSNCPVPCSKWMGKFSRVAEFYCDLLDLLKIQRLSIVRAYESPKWSDDTAHTWTEDKFAIELVAPAHVSPTELAKAGKSLRGITRRKVDRPEGVVAFTGEW